MCDSTSRSTLLAQVAVVRHHLVACRPAASNRREMLCRTTSHDSSFGLSQQYLKNPYADLAQCSQCSSSTRGTKDAISPTARRQASARADARKYACRHPHTRAVNLVGARLLRYLRQEAGPILGPIWGLGLIVLLEYLRSSD